MDTKEPVKLNKELFMQTMADDLARAQKKLPHISPGEMVREAILPTKPSAPSGPPSVKAMPPDKLPVAESIPVLPKPIIEEVEEEEVSWFSRISQFFQGIFGKGQIEQTEKEPVVLPADLPADNNFKFVAIILAIVLVVGGAGGFFYWWNYLRPTPSPSLALTHFECRNNQCLEVEGSGDDQCQSDQACQPIEPAVPDSLIQVEETKTIEISDETEIFNEVKSISSQEQVLGSFKRILIKLVNGEKQYANLNTIVSGLGLNLPTELVGNYTLFLYSQEQGNRLGLIIDLSPEIETGPLLEQWENNILAALDRPFFLGESPAPASLGFQDNLYQNVAVRYLNFPTSDLSVDYAKVGHNLVIAFSRNSMYAAIDRLLAASVQ